MDVQESRKIEGYLRRLFGNSNIRVVPKPRKDGSADVYLADDKLGEVNPDEEDDEDYNFSMEFRAGESADIPAISNYLGQKFGNDGIRAVRRAKKEDSLEAYLGEEFIGVVFIEGGKTGRSFIFEVPILGIDL